MSHMCFGLLYTQMVHFPAVKDFGGKETWSRSPALTLSGGALRRLGNHRVLVSPSVECAGWQYPVSWAAMRTGECGCMYIFTVCFHRSNNLTKPEFPLLHIKSARPTISLWRRHFGLCGSTTTTIIILIIIITIITVIIQLLTFERSGVSVLSPILRAPANLGGQ